jgi:hypothetical protein
VKLSEVASKRFKECLVTGRIKTGATMAQADLGRHARHCCRPGCAPRATWSSSPFRRHPSPDLPPSTSKDRVFPTPSRQPRSPEPPPGMHRGCQRRVSPRSPEMPCSRVSEVSSDFFRMRSGAILSFALRPAPGQPGRMSEDDAGCGVIGLAVFTPRPSASVGRADTRAAPGPAPRRTRRTRPDNRAGRSRRSGRSGTGR